MEYYLDVALPVPLKQTFSYRFSSNTQGEPAIGARVRVTFAGRKLVGIIVNASKECIYDPNKVKDIDQIIDNREIIPPELLHLCLWASRYYQHAIGEVISSAIPLTLREGKEIEPALVYTLTREGKGLPGDAFKRAKKQNDVHSYLLANPYLSKDQIKAHGFSSSAIKSLEQKQIIVKKAAALGEEKFTAQSDLIKETPLELNAEQEQAIAALNYHHFQCYLLHGETGSGKTELYMHAVARVLNAGMQALVLIPEIGLSPQTISRFQKRFSIPIAQLHSNVAEGERAQAWEDAKSGKARIVIGTRLASLTPFKELGIIVVDEEHDRSYKQHDGFKYSARDISIYRAHSLNIPIILGTATPSLESLFNAKTKKYTYLKLLNRAGLAQKPLIKTVDCRGAKLTAGLSEESLKHINHTLERGEQCLIFVNRRGYAPALICQDCGWSADCQYCDSRMTLHLTHRHLRCHHCNRSRPIPRKCQNCASEKLETSGYGTEQIENSLSALFPDTPIERIDRDTTRKKNSLENKLKSALEAQACIFIGTQMLAKGHHLPHLTLVVIADADQGLLSPDYRTLESVGQVITQVAGRAGREEKNGKVLVQSFRPEHPLLISLINEGYTAFAKQLLEQRKAANLPPFSHTTVFRAESKRGDICIDFLEKVRNILVKNDANNVITLVGPHPSSMEKVNDRFRFCLQAFCKNRGYFQSQLKEAITEIDQLALSKRTRWSVDVDSVSPA